MYIGLFFGSFNPIHTGHLMIANYIVESTSLDRIWFVVSPQNPLKQKQTLLNEYDRYHLVELAIEGNFNLMASNIEFSLPKPSYTIDTLTYLKEKHPKNEFALIMGMDNAASLPKWKNYEILLSQYRIYIYPRPGYEMMPDLQSNPNLEIVPGVPYLPISSTFIREQIKAGKSMRYFLPDQVRIYIEEMGLFK